MVIAAIAAIGVVIAGAANALIAYLFFVRHANEQKEFRCPECGTSVNEAETLCPQCHVSFVQDEAVCPSCGDVVPALAEVCRSCGTLFHEEERFECPQCHRHIPPASTQCRYCKAEFWSPVHPASNEEGDLEVRSKSTEEESAPGEAVAV